MSRNFVVNISSIDTFADGLKNEAIALEGIVDELITMARGIDEFFDTPSAHLMQEGMLKFLKNAKKPCQDIGELSIKVNMFNRNYEAIYNDTKRSVGDENE